MSLMSVNTKPTAHLQNGHHGHPIKVVENRTGLTAHTIRVWEKRYEVVAPGRSSGGHRLYSDRDVERLMLLH